MAFFDRALDSLLRAGGNAFTRSRRPSASVGLLGEARMIAADRVLARYRDRGAWLCDQWDRGDRNAAESFGELATSALLEMRREVLAVAKEHGFIESMAARAHERWSDTDEPEILDDPDLDRDMRVRILEHLDATNTLTGNYAAFFRAIEPLLAPNGTTRVLDLAAGHGGFALAATRIAKERGLDVRFTASDLKDEYLDIGRANAREHGLDVDFVVQDALDLRGAQGYDVITCTQSLHHFPPALVARMFREAARVATRGVLFVDGSRSIGHAALVAGVGLMRWRDRAFAHDAWVSFRRFFTAEELGLLTRLGPEAPQVEAKWSRPAHCLVRWKRTS